MAEAFGCDPDFIHGGGGPRCMASVRFRLALPRSENARWMRQDPDPAGCPASLR